MNTILWIIIAILLGIYFVEFLYTLHLTSISSVFIEAIFGVINKRLKN